MGLAIISISSVSHFPGEVALLLVQPYWPSKPILEPLKVHISSPNLLGEDHIPLQTCGSSQRGCLY